MHFYDSWYWLKDRRYSSYISSRKRDARRENRDLVARFQHGGIASLPAIIRGIEISKHSRNRATNENISRFLAARF